MKKSVIHRWAFQTLHNLVHVSDVYRTFTELNTRHVDLIRIEYQEKWVSPCFARRETFATPVKKSTGRGETKTNRIWLNSMNYIASFSIKDDAVTTTPQMKNLIGQVRKTARAARTLTQFCGVLSKTTTWNYHVWGFDDNWEIDDKSFIFCIFLNNAPCSPVRDCSFFTR